jgi:hypothetical protein
MSWGWHPLTVSNNRSDRENVPTFVCEDIQAFEPQNCDENHSGKPFLTQLQSDIWSDLKYWKI